MAGAKQEGQDVFTKGIQKVAIWVGFAITISGLIGSYYTQNYKTNENEKHIADIEARVRVLEKMNPELLLQQLKSIENMQNQMDQKITSTNNRVDEVLRILINK